jgi:hypothetical protein
MQLEPFDVRRGWAYSPSPVAPLDIGIWRPRAELLPGLLPRFDSFEVPVVPGLIAQFGAVGGLSGLNGNLKGEIGSRGGNNLFLF